MELQELFWSQLQETDTPDIRTATEESIETAYRYGLVDTQRFSLAQWKAAFSSLPAQPGGYRVRVENLPLFKNYFYTGKIQKPFDPMRLKLGPRPLAWLNEIYQKVLRFETLLTLPQWNQKVEKELKPRFVKQGSVQFDAELRDLLLQWLEDHASPLRRLELWVQMGQGPEAPAKPLPEKKPSPLRVHDAYQAKPEEIQKKAAVDKLYYQYEQHPRLNDDEALSFLDELSSLEEEEESEDPEIT